MLQSCPAIHQPWPNSPAGKKPLHAWDFKFNFRITLSYAISKLKMSETNSSVWQEIDLRRTLLQKSDGKCSLVLMSVGLRGLHGICISAILNQVCGDVVIYSIARYYCSFQCSTWFTSKLISIKHRAVLVDSCTFWSGHDTFEVATTEILRSDWYSRTQILT